MSPSLILRSIIENRWLVASIALAAALIGVMFAFSTKPLYEANILIQVKEPAPRDRELPGNLPAAFDLPTQAATEVEILRSRSVISRAVDATRLDIVTAPKYFPFLGAMFARINPTISEPGLFGYGGYVWGAEKLSVPILNLPEKLVGRRFVLTAQDEGRFVLSHDELGIQVRGKAGETARAHTRFGDIEILVEQLAAKPGAQFSVQRIARLQAVEQLQNALTVSERGKQSNIIGVSLKGAQPEQLSRILNEIGDEYIRLNTAQELEQAKNAQLFFKQQLEESKQNLERSESRMTELRSKNETFDVNEEARILLQQSVALQSRLADLKQKRDELLINFTEAHPTVMLLSRQMQEANRELARIREKSRTLPAVEQELRTIARDKQLNLDMYSQLLGLGRQFSMVEPGRVGNVRLLDRAEPPIEPVTMKRSTMIAVACLAGLMLGMFAALLRNVIRRGIHGSREVEQSLGLAVTAVIPHSDNQKKCYKKIQRNASEVMVLSHDSPADGTIESLRILRSTLQFLMRDAKRNIIMITGPTPEVGKSFISANFAAVLASVGKRVLPIDGDMRTGYLHRYFGLKRHNGLSEVIAMRAMADAVIHKSVVDNLDFISTGNFPEQPAELLAHANFDRLLQMLSPRYDYIIIDTAPVLDFSDALIVGTHAEVIFNILRDGVTSIHEAEEAAKRFARVGLAVTGCILNDQKAASSRYGYGSRYYSMAHRPGRQDDDAERVRLISA